MRWFDGITDSIDMNLGEIQEMVRDSEAWHAAVCSVEKSLTLLSNWETTTYSSYSPHLRYFFSFNFLFLLFPSGVSHCIKMSAIVYSPLLLIYYCLGWYIFYEFYNFIKYIHGMKNVNRYIQFSTLTKIHFVTSLFFLSRLSLNDTFNARSPEIPKQNTTTPSLLFQNFAHNVSIVIIALYFSYIWTYLPLFQTVFYFVAFCSLLKAIWHMVGAQSIFAKFNWNSRNLHPSYSSSLNYQVWAGSNWNSNE